MEYSGKIEVIIGPMYSGKTTELLRRSRRYFFSGKKCLIIKHSDDIRYDQNNIVTHDTVKCAAIKTDLLSKIEGTRDFQTVDVICIDEIQFYPDAAKMCDKWANEGKIIIAAGLISNFMREPFEQVSLLLAKADEISHLKAVCTNTGLDAPFTRRISKETQIKVIGGCDKYIAASRKAYFNKEIDKSETETMSI